MFQTKKQTSSDQLNSKKTHKAQVAAEFMLYTGIFIFVAIVAFIVVSQTQNTEIPYRQSQVVRETGENFANVISLSIRGGPGFEYTYTFPQTIFSKPYKIYFPKDSNQNLIIEWEGPYGMVSYSYPTPAYSYVQSGCLKTADTPMVSNECANQIRFINKKQGTTQILTITQDDVIK